MGNIRVLIMRASSKSSSSPPHQRSSMLIDMHPFSRPSHFLPWPALKRYGGSSSGGREELFEKGGHDDETITEEEIVRAPSLAEEFKRLEEEKAKESSDEVQAAEQGVASQTVDKTVEALDEAAGGNGNGELDPVKSRYKEHEPGADYRRRGVNTTS